LDFHRLASVLRTNDHELKAVPEKTDLLVRIDRKLTTTGINVLPNVLFRVLNIARSLLGPSHAIET
jgi:hypothetical protein